MKITLRKAGKLMMPADTISQMVFAKLADGVFSCSVTKPKVNSELPEEIRRLSQNKCYWGFLADFSRTTVNSLSGNDPSWWHKKFKVDYLMPIFCASDSGYAAMFTAMEIVLKECGKDTYQNLFDGVVEMTSTTRASVQQFRLYLEQIERFAHENGVVLRTDPEILKAAFGYEGER